MNDTKAGTPQIKPLSIALYPGRKQWLVKRAAQFFQAYPCRTLIEPFAGSGVVGLSLLNAGKIDRLILVEKDERVVCMLNGLVTDAGLSHRYEGFECTRENVKQLLASEKSAFRYLVQSRCSNRGRFSGGLRGDIDSRWCREMVVRNLRLVFAMRHRITVIHGDGLEVMRQYAADRNVGCLADPPYSADSKSKGHTVYRHHKLNHKRLFYLLAQWRGSWLLTEDNCRMVRRLALCHRFTIKRLRMTTANNLCKKELMIWRKRRLF